MTFLPLLVLIVLHSYKNDHRTDNRTLIDITHTFRVYYSLPTMSDVSVATWKIFLGSGVNYMVWQAIRNHAVKGLYKLSEVRYLQRGSTIKGSFSFTSSSPTPCKTII